MKESEWRRGISWFIFLTLIILAGCAAREAGRPEVRPGTLGSISLYLEGPAVSPLDLTVNISSLEVQGDDGRWHRLVDTPITVNSLALAGKRQVLAERRVPAGLYHKIRISVTQAFIVRQEKADLSVPKQPFEYFFTFQVYPRETTPLFMGWDVANSIAGKYRLDLTLAFKTKAKAVSSSLLYVTSEATHRVTVIDRLTGKEAGSIPVGNSPRGIVLFRDRAYVANARSHTVSVIDATAQRVVETVRLRFGDEPQALAVTSDGRDLFVVNSGSNSVAVIDLQRLSEKARIRVGSRPVNIVVDGRRRRAYVANELSNDVSVIDTFSYRLVRGIRAQSRPYGLAVDPISGLVYVTNMGSNNITVIDGTTLRVIDSLNVGTGAAGLAINSRAGRIYLAMTQQGRVAFYQPGLRVTISWARTGDFPFNLVVDNAERRVYVVNRGSDSVTILDQTTARVIKNIKVGKAPYGLALFAAGRR